MRRNVIREQVERTARTSLDRIERILTEVGPMVVDKLPQATGHRVERDGDVLLLCVDFTNIGGLEAAEQVEDIIRMKLPVDVERAFSTQTDLEGNTTVEFRCYPRKVATF